MPQNKWTINNADGGSTGSDLKGCHIQQTDTGYDFTKPNNQVLESTTSTTPPFTFPEFDFKDLKWTITVSSLSNPATGGWSNKHPSIQGEEGTWSAGATADDDAEEGEDAAAAAY